MNPGGKPSQSANTGIYIVATVLALGVLYRAGAYFTAPKPAMVITGRTPVLEPGARGADAQPVEAAPHPVMETASTPAPGAAASQTTGSAAPVEIFVHVAGAVVRPAMYRLAAGSRVDDAVRAAGGPTLAANMDAVNLAAPLTDGRQVLIPTRQEASAPPPVQGSGEQPYSPGAQMQGEPAGAEAGSPRASRSSKVSDPVQDAVNINTASVGELERLPGIGPAMAGRIIEYRNQNGPFADVSQLTYVNGIGEKKLAKVRAYVRVN